LVLGVEPFEEHFVVYEQGHCKKRIRVVSTINQKEEEVEN